MRTFGVYGILLLSFLIASQPARAECNDAQMGAALTAEFEPQMAAAQGSVCAISRVMVKMLTKAKAMYRECLAGQSLTATLQEMDVKIRQAKQTYADACG